MALIARVDKDVCISSGRCVGDAPSAFRFDADEIAEAVQPPPPGLSEETLLNVARNCPSGAITLHGPAEQEVPLD